MSATLVPTRPVPTTPTRPRTQAPPKVGRRVQRGIAYLDATKPGWEQWVIPSRIDMLSNNNCVLGQAFGHVVHGVPVMSRFRWPFWGWRRGFLTNWRQDNKIRHEWRDYVTYRRMVTS